MIEHRVIMWHLPGYIRSAVRLSPDGYPTIYINDQLSPQARRKALAHELAHLSHEDFYSDRSIHEVEGHKEGI